jgi:hypothetical protein
MASVLSPDFAAHVVVRAGPPNFDTVITILTPWNIMVQKVRLRANNRVCQPPTDVVNADTTQGSIVSCQSPAPGPPRVICAS